MDDELLPEILLSTSNNTNTNFFMPDASILVSQRKEALERDELIESYKREYVIEEPENSQGSSDGEISSCMNDLNLEKWNNYICSENPGINLSKVDLNVFCQGLPDEECKFALSTLDKLRKLDGEQLKAAINLLLELMEMCSDQETVLRFNELVCFFLLLIVITLDKKCRSIADKNRVTNLVQQLFCNVNEEHYILADFIAQEILSRFHHFHDRLYLCDNILIIKKFALNTPDEDPSQFAAKIAQSLVYCTLCDLIGSENESKIPKNAHEVKKLLKSGKWCKSLQPYEQYGVIKLLNLLFDFLPSKFNNPEDKSNAMEAKSKIIAYISSWNKIQGKSSGDVYQVKVLTTRTKLLWEDEDLNTVSADDEISRH